MNLRGLLLLRRPVMVGVFAVCVLAIGPVVQAATPPENVMSTGVAVVAGISATTDSGGAFMIPAHCIMLLTPVRETGGTVSI